MHIHHEPVGGIAGDIFEAAALESLDGTRPIAFAPCKVGSALVRLAAHV